MQNKSLVFNFTDSVFFVFFFSKLLSKSNTYSGFNSQHSIWYYGKSFPSGQKPHVTWNTTQWLAERHTHQYTPISGTAWPSIWLLSISRKGHSCVVFTSRRRERQNTQHQIVMTKNKQQMAVMLCKLSGDSIGIDAENCCHGLFCASIFNHLYSCPTVDKIQYY